jgi:hypothetical protein
MPHEVMMVLDVSLTNSQLYQGLEIELDAGRLNLRTPPAQAIPVMVANLQKVAIDPEEVVLTGRMAIWAYLAVFHELHGRTRRVFYSEPRLEAPGGQGRTAKTGAEVQQTRILIAAHG